MSDVEEDMFEEEPSFDDEGVNDDEVDAEEVIDDEAPEATKKNVHGSRRGVEDYLEKKRLKQELGSVFEDDDFDFDLNDLNDDADE